MKQGIATAMGLAAALVAGHAVAQEGDPEAGESNFRQCSACHTLEEGQHRVGPSLHGVFGRQAGTAEGFNYSEDTVAAGEAGVVWDEETLFAYLADPAAFLAEVLDKDRGRTRMAMKYPDEQFRRDVIAYLKQETAD